MAYLYERKNGRIEIREAHSTPRGPRSRTLASFRGPLTEADLDRAESSAVRRFDREAVCARARDMGVPVRRSSANSHARDLLAALRTGATLDPILVRLVGDALADRESRTIPEEASDVVEWIGVGDLERGRALRDVLRLYDRIARSRDPVETPPEERFPRFSVSGKP
jgi:hypothetical protein